MDFSTLSLYNPWWDLSESIENLENNLLSYYKNAKFKRDYKNAFDFNSDGIYILRGPRQIGKSTMMKVAIMELIKKEERKSILFLPLDTVTDYKTLRDVLFDYLQYAKDEKKRYVFLDEISMVDQWQRAIKELRDNTIYKGDFFILSGSSAWDIKRSSERLPGRKGKVKSDVLLFPMNFSENYDNLTESKENKIILDDILYLKKDSEFKLKVESRKVEILFQQYINTGGIPSVIDAFQTGESLKYFYDILWDVIIGDIEKQGLSRSRLLEILRFCAERISNRFSWNSCASSIGMDTKTFQKYIDVLAYNYSVSVFKSLDKNTLFPREKKQKKMFFYDLFLIKTLENKLGINSSNAAIIENIVAINLLYKYGKNLENGLKDYYGVGYWYSKEGKEIDFLVDGIPIELKYRNSINSDDLKTIKKNPGNTFKTARTDPFAIWRR